MCDCSMLGPTDHKRLARRNKHHIFRLVFKKLVDCLPSTWTAAKAVVIEKHYSMRVHTRIKERKRVQGRLVQIHVDVRKAEPSILHFRKSFWNPTSKQCVTVEFL